MGFNSGHPGAALLGAGLALVLHVGTAAGQGSPPACSATRLNLLLAANTSNVPNGGHADYEVDVRNNELQLTDACDVRDAFVTFCCPGADGSPDTSDGCTFLPVTSTPCIVNGPEADCVPTDEALDGIDLPADGSNDKFVVDLTCRIDLETPGVVVGVARAAVEEGYRSMQTASGVPQPERVRVIPVLVSRPTPTPTLTPTDAPSHTPTDTPTLTPTATPIAVSCAGDCNGDGEVTVDEIQRLTNLALGKTPTPCPPGDANGDGDITVDEVLLAVMHGLNGCPDGPATPSPAATLTPTQSATTTPTPTLVPTLALEGSCLRSCEPGMRCNGQGLRPCNPGTRVEAARCVDITQCLDPQQEAARDPIGTAVADGDGSFSISLPADRLRQGDTIVLQAEVECEAANGDGCEMTFLYRSLLQLPSRTMREESSEQGETANGADIEVPEVIIDPVSEAGVDLIDQVDKLEFCFASCTCDEKAVMTLDRVRQVNSSTQFLGEGVVMATELAKATALEDSIVARAIGIGSPAGCSADRSTLAVGVDGFIVSLGDDGNYDVDLRNDPFGAPDACDIFGARLTFCCPGMDGNPGSDCTLIPVETTPCVVNGPQPSCLPTDEAVQGIDLPADGSNDQLALGNLVCALDVSPGVTSAVARVSFVSQLGSICPLQTPQFSLDTSVGIIPPPFALVGSVTLEGRPERPDPTWMVPLRVTLTRLAAPGMEEPETCFVTTNAYGDFICEDLAQGSYVACVKNAHTLQSCHNVTIPGFFRINFGALPEGDVNDDNCVTQDDASIMSAALNSCAGGGGYDARADLDEDGCVTATDVSLLEANFEQCGDEPPAAP
jgi:hypothetical protein